MMKNSFLSFSWQIWRLSSSTVRVAKWSSKQRGAPIDARFVVHHYIGIVHISGSVFSQYPYLVDQWAETNNMLSSAGKTQMLFFSFVPPEAGCRVRRMGYKRAVERNPPSPYRFQHPQGLATILSLQSQTPLYEPESHRVFYRSKGGYTPRR